MNYRFYLSSTLSVSKGIEVFPQSGYELGLQMFNDSDYLFKRFKLNKSIILVKGKDEGYSQLKDITDSGVFANIYFIITSGDIVKWTGIFNTIDCQFTIQGGAKVEFTPVVFDEYTEILKNKNKEVNVLDGIEYTDKSVKGYARSTIEFKLVISTGGATSLDGWYYKERKFQSYVNPFGTTTGFYAVIFARERIKNLPSSTPEDNWEYNEDLDFYYRDTTLLSNLEFVIDMIAINKDNESLLSFDTYDFVDSSGNEVSSSTSGRYEFQLQGKELKSYDTESQYTNRYAALYARSNVDVFNFYIRYFNQYNYFFRFRNFIEKIINSISPDTAGVKSTFFFNDSSDNTVNYGVNNYVNGEANILNDLFISDLYDFFKKNPSKNSTELLVTFTDWFEELNTLFYGKLFWFIDLNNNFRIEHIYYKNYYPTIINLTTLDDGKWVRADSNYEIDKSNLYNSIKIQNENASNIDFRTMNVISNIPLIGGERENSMDKSFSNLYLDINYINVNEVSNKNGYVMVTAEDDGNDYIINESDTGIFSGTGEYIDNVKLTLSNIFNEYCKLRLPSNTVTLESIDSNTVEYNALSTEKYKLQNKITFITSENVDWRTLIVTNLGTGDIYEYELFFAQNKSVVKLLY